MYGVGRFKLGEPGAMRFLADMESLMSAARATSCLRHVPRGSRSGSHRIIPVSRCRNMNGGKKEFCALTRETAAGLQHVAAFDERELHRRQGEARTGESVDQRSELSTNTARLSIHGANVTLRTVSNDEITLVQTLLGREAAQGEERGLQGRRDLTAPAALLSRCRPPSVHRCAAWAGPRPPARSALPCRRCRRRRRA